MNRSKQVGTRAESAVVSYLRGIWPHAERRTLSGQYDKGDVSPGNGLPVVVEVKPQADFDAWLEAQKAARQAAAAPAAQTAAVVSPVDQVAAVRVAHAE